MNLYQTRIESISPISNDIKVEKHYCPIKAEAWSIIRPAMKRPTVKRVRLYQITLGVYTMPQVKRVLCDIAGGVDLEDHADELKLMFDSETSQREGAKS